MIQPTTFTFESEISAEEKARIQAEVKKLSALNPLYSFVSILLNWLIILSTAIIAYRISNPFLSIIAVFIIGARQHGLLLIMHDGAHYRLALNKKANQYISDFFCAYPIFVTTSKYRDSHLSHHKYLNTDLDPDWQLKKGLDEWKFPKPRTFVFILLLKHLVGLNTLNMISKLYRFGVNNTTATKHSKTETFYKIFRLAYYIILIAVLSFFHLWSIFLLYWLLPAFTVLPFLLRLRSLAEHFGLPWSNELNSARNVSENVFERIFLVPQSANYHLDHHLYPSVPFYNLKKLHKVLLKNPVYKSNAVNSHGYLSLNKESVLAELENNMPL